MIDSYQVITKEGIEAADLCEHTAIYKNGALIVDHACNGTRMQMNTYINVMLKARCVCKRVRRKEWRVPVSLDFKSRKVVPDPPNICFRQVDPQCSHVLFKVLNFLGSPYQKISTSMKRVTNGLLLTGLV